MGWGDKAVSPVVYTPAAADAAEWALDSGVTLENGKIVVASIDAVALKAYLKWQDYDIDSGWLDRITGAHATNITPTKRPGISDAVVFDGTDDFLILPTAWFASKGAFTVVCRAKVVAATQYGVLFGNGTNIALYQADGNLKASGYAGGTRSDTTNPFFTLNAFLTYALVASGTTVKFYVNGVQSLPTASYVMSSVSISELILGAFNSSGQYPGRYSMKYLAIYDAEKSQAQIESIHNFMAAQP